MKYCVLVKISKQQLSFWYQLEDGVHTPLSINGPNTIPLCFYVYGNDFKIGDFAKERFLVNDKHAYNDYFEIIKDPAKHFTLHGDSKPVKQLLYYGLENILSHFIKTILYKNESIEGLRTNFCLRFWFDDDIQNQEKVLVENLFKEAGYENVAEVNAELHLNKELSVELKSTKSRLCISAISNDLYVKLFKAPAYSFLSQIKLEQMGSDPRAKILAKLILEDIKDANPHIYIEEEKEIAHLINHCVKLLSSLSPLMRNEIELSTGARADYKIRLAQLDERLTYHRGIDDKVIPQLESMLSSNGLAISAADIILIGDELNTNYFKEKLTKKFSNVYGVGSIIQDKLLKALFFDITSLGYPLGLKVSNVTPVEPIRVDERAVPISKTPPIVTTPPKVSTPPIVKTPAVQNAQQKENKPIAVNTPPRVSKPLDADTVSRPNKPPVVKIPQKVNTPPVINTNSGEGKSKVPPPPPPPPIKKK